MTFLKRLEYLVGFIQIVMTPFLCVYDIGMYKKVHILKMCILLPLRYYTFKSQNSHYYMFEFCYFISIMTSIYLLGDIYYDDVFKNYFLALYGTLSGPLLAAIYFNKDKMFQHSSSHLTSLYLHLTPALLVWSIKWHNNTTNYNELFPDDGLLNTYFKFVNDVKYFYLSWFIGYYLIVFWFKYERIEERNYRTIAKDVNMSSVGYMTSHITGFIMASFVSMIMFHNYTLNTLVLFVTFCFTVWTASGKYVNMIEKNNASIELPKELSTQMQFLTPLIKVSEENGIKFAEI